MKNKRLNVVWERTALVELGSLFNVDHEKVFKRSKTLLSMLTFHNTENVAEYPGFKYNGYFWAFVHNVIVVYRVSYEKKTVYVEACYYANTAASHEIFWGIDPDTD